MGEAVPFVIREQCFVCSRWFIPGDIQHLPGGVRRCFQCYENHLTQMCLTLQQPPPECQVCRTPWDQLPTITGSGNTEMYMQWKDGCYQLMCKTCSDAYERKRLDLFGNSAYGALRKLKGAR